MRKCNFLLLLILFALVGMTSNVVCSTKKLKKSIENVLKEKLGDDVAKKKKKKGARTIEFSYKDADLIDVINDVASYKGENIILPSGAAAIKSKLTIDIPQKLTVNESWDILNTILDVAGYGISLNGDMYEIQRAGGGLLHAPLRIFKEPSRIFISSPYKQIPDTDERIIYLAYFTNIQVPQAPGDGQNVIQKLLKEYLSPEAAKGGVQFIPSSNGVMIIDKASNIRSVMKIFKELDKAGIKEYIEIIPLKNTSAVRIEKLFVGEGGVFGRHKRQRYRLGKKRRSETKYFEKSTKVVAEPRTNSLIVLGSKESVEKIKDFIFRYVDIAIDSGRSILHRRKLDYLDCNKLRDVLKAVVGAGGADQQARPGARIGGPERFFSNPIIETDRPAEQEGPEAGKGKYKYSGTNSLLIAANNDDWIKIDELIGQLDKPLQQVIIEVLIVDLRLEDTKGIGSQTRNPALAPIFKLGREGRGINAQSAQLADPILQECKECSLDSKTIKADLMEGLGTEDSPNAFLKSTAGSTLFTISDRDGSTWSVLKLLDLYNHAKVLSHPYIVTVNNKEAKVVVGLEKQLQGSAETTAAGATRIKIIPVKADIKVDVKPRIGGTIDGKKIVNLQIGISINEFADATNLDQAGAQPRFIREIATNANIKSGEILALGGLIKTDNVNTSGRAPILGQIPILGWLFKSRSKKRVKDNLTVFIRTTVVEPEFRGGFGAYTKDYIEVAKKYSRDGGLFDGLRDPVTRWFFGSKDETVDAIDDFVEQHEKVVSLEDIMLAKGKNIANQDIVLAQNDLKSLMDMPDNPVAEDTLAQKLASASLTSVPMTSELQASALNNAPEQNIVAESTLKEMDQVVIAANETNKADMQLAKEVELDDKLKELLEGLGNPLANHLSVV